MRVATLLSGWLVALAALAAASTADVGQPTLEDVLVGAETIAWVRVVDSDPVTFEHEGMRKACGWVAQAVVVESLKGQRNGQHVRFFADVLPSAEDGYPDAFVILRLRDAASDSATIQWARENESEESYLRTRCRLLAADRFARGGSEGWIAPLYGARTRAEGTPWFSTSWPSIFAESRAFKLAEVKLYGRAIRSVAWRDVRRIMSEIIEQAERTK